MDPIVDLIQVPIDLRRVPVTVGEHHGTYRLESDTCGLVGTDSARAATLHWFLPLVLGDLPDPAEHVWMVASALR